MAETTFPHCDTCTCGPKLKVTSIKMTCSACPAQWEGKVEDGRMIYVRFRHGYLSIRLSDEPTDDVFKAVEGNEFFGYGHPFADGSIDYAELRQITGRVIDWPEVSL